jgi:hypothetical protein
VFDCGGVCNGPLVNDECGVCDGGNVDQDECGVCNGPGAIYACGCEDEILYYFDGDGDGLGTNCDSGGTVFCSDSAPDGGVDNCDDLDDDCYSNSHDCNGICDGTSVEDECGTCDGSGVAHYCADSDGDGWGNPGWNGDYCPGFEPEDWLQNCDDFNDGDTCLSNADVDNDNICDIHVGPVWYVETSGSDIIGNGSEGYSFATIQHALEASEDGHTIYVGPGTYYVQSTGAHSRCRDPHR